LAEQAAARIDRVEQHLRAGAHFGGVLVNGAGVAGDVADENFLRACVRAARAEQQRREPKRESGFIPIHVVVPPIHRNREKFHVAAATYLSVRRLSPARFPRRAKRRSRTSKLSATRRQAGVRKLRAAAPPRSSFSQISNKRSANWL